MAELLVLTGWESCSVAQGIDNMEGVADALNCSHVLLGQRAALQNYESVLICDGIKALHHPWVLVLAQQHVDVVYPASLRKNQHAGLANASRASSPRAQAHF